MPSGSPNSPTNGTACVVLERGPGRGGERIGAGGRGRVEEGGGFP